MTDLQPAVRGMTLPAPRLRRDEISRIADAHGARNVRVFGSVARGDAAPESDVNLLVEVDRGVSGFAYFRLLAALERELEELLGCKVDVGTEVQEHARSSVERDLVPL